MYLQILKLVEELLFSLILYSWTCHAHLECAKCYHSGYSRAKLVNNTAKLISFYKLCCSITFFFISLDKNSCVIYKEKRENLVITNWSYFHLNPLFSHPIVLPKMKSLNVQDTNYDQKRNSKFMRNT
jgi:hypothetical protein